MKADLGTHHIEGYAQAAYDAGKRGRDAYFDVPLISHIEDNLWVGGILHGISLPEDFTHVVSLYKWEQYKLGPNTTRSEYEMYDSGDIPDVTQLNEIADEVVESLKKGKTLVHCQAGLNRSNLVSALALIKMGATPEEAIKKLRDARSPLVLCNAAFENWLLYQDGAPEKEEPLADWERELIENDVR